MEDINPTQLKQRLDRGEQPVMIDVREDFERQAGNIGGLHIPMGVLPSQLEQIEKYKNQEVIVYCRSGGRSGSAKVFLTQQGFTKVSNLVGGMNAWKATVDPALTVL